MIPKNMLADSPVLREIIKMYLSLNRDTLITFLSFVVIVACLYFVMYDFSHDSLLRIDTE